VAVHPLHIPLWVSIEISKQDPQRGGVVKVRRVEWLWAVTTEVEGAGVDATTAEGLDY
jgi:hypothetical protein